MKKLLPVLTTCLLALTPALSHAKGDAEFSGDVKGARLLFPQLEMGFCKKGADPSCQITGVRLLGDWVYYTWYEGETGGEAIARKSAKGWQTLFIKSGYDDNLAAAVKNGVPLAKAQLLFPVSCAISTNTLLKKAELAQCSAWDLMIARNSIYARHGRPFQSKVLRDYFLSWPWYKPDPKYLDTRLSPLETQNIALILQTEKQKKYLK